MGKLTVEESSLVGIANIIRTKTNKSSKEKIAFPEEFKSLLNGITPVKNGVSPTTITNNGTHSTDNYPQIKVEVPSSIPDGYIKPTGTKNIDTNGEHIVTEFEKVNVSVRGKYYESSLDLRNMSSTVSCEFNVGFEPRLFLIVAVNPISTSSTTYSGMLNI